MRRARFLAAGALLAASGAALALEIPRWTIDGGGRTSTGGSFAVTGTVGQPDAAVATGGAFALRGGFWVGGGTLTPVADVLPARVTVYPAAPNPFNPATNLALDLPAPTQVVVDIHDVRGRRVRLLLDETRIAGRHVLRWDGTGDDGAAMPSGVYLVRVRAGEVDDRQKITLMR